MKAEEKQALTGLCKIEIKRWKAAAKSDPNMRYMVELMEVALAALTAQPLGFIRAEDAALLPFERKHTCVEVGIYKSQSFDTDQSIYTAPAVSLAELMPEGWKLVPVEPTEQMVLEGFESDPEISGDPCDLEAYESMSGCKQAAHKARLCWAAMLAASPTPPK